MQWGDGLRVNPGQLHANATRLQQVHQSLEQQIQRHDALDLGSWRGEAQRAQRSKHRELVTDLRQHARRLPPTTDALESAASSFERIQQSQRQLIERAAQWRYEIQDSGWLRDLESGLRKADPRRLFQRARIQGSVLSIIVRLNATDLALAAKLRVVDTANNVLGAFEDYGDNVRDLLEAGADKALSGLEWLGGKIRDGLDWGRGVIEDAWQWGKDALANLGERLGHAGTALGRLSETMASPPKWLQDLVQHGEIPQLAEVLGSGAYLLGQAAGVPANFIANDDVHLFDDGTPYLARPDEVTPYSVPGGQFNGINDVVNPMMDVYNTHDPNNPDDHPQVQVTAVEGADGQVRYVVSIPGTTESMRTLDGWNGGAAGTDWAANLKGVGYGDTAATQSIMHAIDEAIAQDQAARGISGGGHPEVLLSGHSQGGIIAGNIAANPEFTQHYDVGGVVSAGSPVDTLGIPGDIPVYNYQNELDPVPRVDLGGVPTGTPDNVTNIVFEHEGSRSPEHTHAQQTYADNIADLQHQTSGENAMKQQQMNADLDRFYHGEATAYRVPYGRETK
ncbi:WXG100 family type VII secretion target [uncultured Tessaracoccus sp.]|uniref:WXG100 family type VII secretion target n=1 Tax=uncultured Tessaracoccus sp. TaxID=905023 RepID=UPI0025D1C689|nr:hypothetical protein [uncultured Tessaracoccus sp.]